MLGALASTPSLKTPGTIWVSEFWGRACWTGGLQHRDQGLCAGRAPLRGDEGEMGEAAQHQEMSGADRKVGEGDRSSRGEGGAP